MTTRPVYFTAKRSPAAARQGQASTDPPPVLESVANLQVGTLVLITRASDQAEVSIHLSDVIYMPGSHGTALAFKELQRGGMRIFHGTKVAGPKLFLRGPGETLNV